MTSGVFLDTSALYAAADRSSERHADCAGEFRSLVGGRQRLVTTALVLAELHALTLARAGDARATEAARNLVESVRIEIVDVGLSDLETAVDFVDGRPGRAITLADAVSFATMRKLGIDRAFTLDADFGAEGFQMIPPR